MRVEKIAFNQPYAFINKKEQPEFKGGNIPKAAKGIHPALVIGGMLLYGAIMLLTHPITQLLGGAFLTGYGGVSSYKGLEHYHGDKINLFFNYDGHLLEFLKAPFGKQTVKGAGLGLLGLILAGHALVRIVNRRIQATDPNWQRLVKSALSPNDK